jgi:response regulator RpfG family c-di-GMP phosphodiesterase
MPGLNVAGLVASLRSNPATAEIPIVFFSAHHDVDQMAAKHNAWGFLRKPFAVKELVQILEKAVGGWPQERHLTTRDPLHREIVAAFHDYWNVIAALSSYTEALLRSEGLPEAEREIVKGQQEAIMKLESKTDHLQSFLRTVVAQTLPGPPGISEAAVDEGRADARDRQA